MIEYRFPVVFSHIIFWTKCHFFHSGVSPFLDDSVEETTGHILQGDFFFSDDHFGSVTAEAKELVSSLLQTPPQFRGTASSTLLHPWFQMVGTLIVPSFFFLFFFQTVKRGSSNYGDVRSVVNWATSAGSWPWHCNPLLLDYVIW